MNRRDTLIIAVLVNAGLLMVLFATALKSDRKKVHYIEEHPLSDLAVDTPPHRIPSTLPLSEPIALSANLQLPVLEEITVTTNSVPTLSSLSPSQPVAVMPPITPSPQNEVTHLSLPAAAAPCTVTVKKGDALEKIARHYHTTVAAIMQENHLTTTQLKIGQVLRLPAALPSGTSHASVPPTTGTQMQQDFYVVKEGDSPWLIASKHQLRLEELLRLNGLDEQSARKLRPGQKIKIR